MTTALGGILRALSDASGRVLVEYRGRRFTGADLLTRIEARAADLRQAGLGAGQTVLIVVSDNLAAIEQMIACWMNGSCGHFVDFRSPPARIAEWRARLSPSLVVGLRAMTGGDVRIQPRDPAATDGFLPVEADPSSRALHLASSGTTGLPTLTDVTQARLAEVLQHSAVELHRDPRGATLSSVSVAFSASAYLWLRHLLVGQPILALDLVHRIEELDTALQRADVVECSLPPGAIRRLLALPSDRVPRYPQLVRFSTVGGPARPEDKVAAVTRLSPVFAMTYSCAGVGLVSRIRGAEILERPSSCGRPALPVVVEIRDGDRRCGPGEVGEVVISTDRVTGHRPGDLGWLDAGGYLHLTGRVQGLLSRKGVNFSAERIVSACLSLPQVIDAGVAVLDGADGDDEAHLVVQAARDRGDSLAGILARHLRQTLPVTEQPDAIHIWSDLPLTPAGKIDQRALCDKVRKKRDDREQH
ncbi:hypothetical protein E7811_11425 [Aliigemmobacter aestuarii]|uniref:AMP-dependent synthetase/ligase domain-containing protein n=1 Tax=Aliigemmobacter aestuarii TaxID=1445661 RepID=A0A4S3MKP7_9RHOB|nr:class I adenylate-forming enzyme family protein [Gemmobacter aestuarii]THD82768.1 hypothetical protein E7811_11425 [Gemmobacter aestuarii]